MNDDDKMLKRFQDEFHAYCEWHYYTNHRGAYERYKNLQRYGTITEPPITQLEQIDHWQQLSPEAQEIIRNQLKQPLTP